jgi:hypothetical protein
VDLLPGAGVNPLVLPNVTSDRICCPECGQRAPYTPRGLPDWHLNFVDGLCAGVFPPYVVARDPKTGERRPVATHAARRRKR